MRIVPHQTQLLSLDLSSLSLESLEATRGSDILLQLRNTLLVTGRVTGFGLEHPLEEGVGVVGLEALVQDTETLAVLGHLCPVTLDVLEVLAEVGKAALKDLAVESSAHDGLEVDVLCPRLLGLGKDKIGGLLDGAEERADLFGVLRKELLVTNVQNGAEAAASEFSELVNSQHLNIVLGTTLTSEPLLKLNHLDVLKTDAGVDLALDDSLGDVHAAANSSVVIGGHAVVRGELVDLDLAKLANIADSLALEGAEVGGDARILEVDDAGEGFVEKTTDGLDGEVSSLGLGGVSSCDGCAVVQGLSYSKSVNHGLEAEVDLASTDDFSNILTVLVTTKDRVEESPYTGVVGLQKSNLDALILKVALGLGQVQRSVVRRSVPRDSQQIVI